LLPERRRIVLDEDINWKLMYELRRRGRTDATALVPEKIDGKKDGALFKALAKEYEPCVLVTYDNRMLGVHRAEIEHHGSTIAVVNEAAFKASGSSDVEAYIRDVVHRWLHRIEIQRPGIHRIYSPQRATRAWMG
jgi:hypothetical protein